MKKVFVMAVAMILSGATVSMAQTKESMKQKKDETMMQDTMTKKKPMKPMKKKPMKPKKDSTMM